MFAGINALLKTLDKFNAIDGQCQELSDEMESILPELADNAIAVSFARDSIKGLNERLIAVRVGAESLTERVSPIVEETPELKIEDAPEPEIEEPQVEETPEQDIEEITEPHIPEEEDDEAGIIIEDATGEIFPIEDDSPIPDFEEERQASPLDRVEDWDELYQAKVEELIGAGAQKEARKLKGQCLEIREAMYDENGDIIHMQTKDSGITKGAQAVWEAAMKEVVRLKADEFIATRTPEQKAVIDEMLDDLEIANPSAEPSAEPSVDELLGNLDDIDEDLDALLNSIE